MPLSPSATRELLAQLGHTPKRFLGQNFLVDGNIVRKSLEEPVRQICLNAGKEGSVIIEEIRKGKPGFGYDALNDKFVNMFEAGIVDPAKVTRSALQNAASIAKNILTTEAIVAEVPEKEAGGPGGGMPDMSGMM